MKAMNVMNAITARRKADEDLSDSRLTGLFSSIKSLRGPHQVESGDAAAASEAVVVVVVVEISPVSSPAAETSLVRNS